MAGFLKERGLSFCLYVLAVLIAIVGFTFFIWPTYLRHKALEGQESELDAKIAAKRQEIAKLADNQRRFRCDREFVEHIARKNNRVFPGELIFIYEDERK